MSLFDIVVMILITDLWLFSIEK